MYEVWKKFPGNPQSHPSRIALKATSSDDSTSSPLSLSSISLPYTGLWLALVVFAFAFAPGELNSTADTALINELISNPLTPDTNDLWFTVWNCFTIVPLALAALVLPGSKGPLPATPFVAGSAFLGYFALGPLMATREPSSGAVSKGDCGFFTRNMFESKIFAALLTAVAISIPITTHIIGDVTSGQFPIVLEDFKELFASSRFVSVATADITILSVIAAALVPEDMRRREMEPNPAYQALTAVPAIGPCLYLLLRDPLQE